MFALGGAAFILFERLFGAYMVKVESLRFELVSVTIPIPSVG